MELPPQEKISNSFFASVIGSVAEFVKVFIIAAAIILPVRLFLIQPFYVRGESMLPNFHENEYLIIDKLTPRLQPYKRGEVIVFRFPSTDRRYLIKRLIGLPGERVRIKNSVITVTNADHPNGLILGEDLYHPYDLGDEEDDKLLGVDEYYVLGDNRPVSFDSEKFGPVKAHQIVGRVVFRGLPLDKMTFFKAPQYK